GGAVYSGYPAMEARRWRRGTMSIPRLPEIFRRLRRVERALGLGAGADEEGEGAPFGRPPPRAILAAVPMKLELADITEETKELRYPEDVTELNARLGRGLCEYRVAEGLEVETAYYRVGRELFFRGGLHGAVKAICARCAEEYTFT